MKANNHMKGISLNENWIVEKHIDFEYKKYILLDYLQKIDKRFTETRLYPYLPQLIEHHTNLVQLRTQKAELSENFTQELAGVELRKLRMIYQQLVKDDDLMKEIDSIINYSLPKFEYYISEGQSIRELIEEKLNIFPVGLVPLYTQEGYLLLNAASKRTEVFQYTISIFSKESKEHREVHTVYLNSDKVSISNTFERIKAGLIRSRPELPNPATYVVETELELPVYETLLPIAKSILMKFVSTSTN